MTSWIRDHVNDVKVHVGAVLLFLIVNAIGYTFAGGLDFVQGWGGGIAAVIATFFLVFKSQGYWAWMCVNASLWCALFFNMGLPLLGWLQVSFLIFSAYGAVQWTLVKYRVGFNPRVRIDVIGSCIALGVFCVSAYAYWPRDGMTIWWALEALSVVFAILAMWMDAFRYRVNWIAWSLSNFMFWPVAYEYGLWGPFFTTFVYQAINVYGWFEWGRDQGRPIVDTIESQWERTDPDFAYSDGLTLPPSPRGADHA